MDKTDELALGCSKSKWKGDPERCRRCDLKLTGRSRKFHDKRCARLWAQDHWYRKARVACRQRFRAKCGCPRVRSHIICRACGVCEGKLKTIGSSLECNHINPRVGDNSSYSCMHHQENLEMLCRPCHNGVTRQQAMDRKVLRDRQSGRPNTTSRSRTNSRGNPNGKRNA